MQYLSIEQIKAIHKEQIKLYGGKKGIHDLGLLESAIAMPKHDYHKTVFDKASAYLFHIVKNHPFIDGNKRVGAQAMMFFLKINGVRTEFDEENLEMMVLDIASGIDITKDEIADFILKYCTIE